MQASTDVMNSYDWALDNDLAGLEESLETKGAMGTRQSRRHLSIAGPEKGKGLSILHLIDKATEESLMDRWFLRSHRAFAGDSSGLVEEAILWGVGHEGYNARQSLRQNLIARFGNSRHFDAVLPYWNWDQSNYRVDNAGWDKEAFFSELAEVSKDGTIMIDRPHETRDGRRRQILEKNNASLVLFPYPNEIFEYRDFMEQALLVHEPHPVNEELFYHPYDQPRPQDIWLAGTLAWDLYPLRVRLAELIEAGQLPGAALRQHPGYGDNRPVQEYVDAGINAQHQEQQLQEHSQAFGRAKICIVTGSRWQYSVQKFGEALAAGCAIVGTLPADRRSAFERFVVPIDNSMTDDELRDVFARVLADEPGRLERARRGQEWILASFTDRHYVANVVRWIRAAQQGQRGIVLPHEWTELPEPLPWDG